MINPANELPKSTLRLSRLIKATPSEVYSAWTQPELLTRWFSPSPDTKSLLAEVDLRVGGRYRIGFDSPEHGVNYVGGEYREIKPAKRLIYTWIWEKPHEFAGLYMLVTVEFNEVPDGTELIMTHERLETQAMHQAHAYGWCGALDQLNGILPGSE